MDNISTIWSNEPNVYSSNQIEIGDITYNFSGNPDSWNLDTWMKYSYLVYKSNPIERVLLKYLNTYSNSKWLDTKWVDNYKTILYLTPRSVAMLLKALRKQNKYTLSELSSLTGFSKTSISHRESNNLISFPNLKTIEIYLNSFNVSLIQFLFLLCLYATRDALSS